MRCIQKEPAGRVCGVPLTNGECTLADVYLDGVVMTTADEETVINDYETVHVFVDISKKVRENKYSNHIPLLKYIRHQLESQ